MLISQIAKWAKLLGHKFSISFSILYRGANQLEKYVSHRNVCCHKIDERNVYELILQMTFPLTVAAKNLSHKDFMFNLRILMFILEKTWSK